MTNGGVDRGKLRRKTKSPPSPRSPPTSPCCNYFPCRGWESDRALTGSALRIPTGNYAGRRGGKHAPPWRTCLPPYLPSTPCSQAMSHDAMKWGILLRLEASQIIADHRRSSQIIADHRRSSQESPSDVWSVSCARWNISIFSCDVHHCDGI